MVACSANCRAGRATLTTVPSMKTMLEPRMAATRTQRPEDLGECIPFVFWHEGEGEDIADAGHERSKLS